MVHGGGERRPGDCLVLRLPVYFRFSIASVRLSRLARLRCVCCFCGSPFSSTQPRTGRTSTCSLPDFSTASRATRAAPGRPSARRWPIFPAVASCGLRFWSLRPASPRSASPPAPGEHESLLPAVQQPEACHGMSALIRAADSPEPLRAAHTPLPLGYTRSTYLYTWFEQSSLVPS